MKEPRQVEDTSLFDEILKETPQEIKNFIDNTLEIAHQISVLMEKNGLLQKDLARLLEKSEAEISRMLSGTHNLTIKTISKIEAVLNAKVITTPYRVEVDRLELESSIMVTATTSYNPVSDLISTWAGSRAGEYSYPMAA